MRRLYLVILCGLLSVAALTIGRADERSPAPEGTPFVCSATAPNGVHPPGEARSPGDYGNEALWTNLAMWAEDPGIVEVPRDGHLLPDGQVVGLKWAWWRFVEGELTI